MSLTTLAVLSLVILSVFSSPSIQPSMASGASRPWPMFHQNAQHTGLSAFLGPTLPSLKWKFETGGAIHASPAIGHGRIYVGSHDGNLYALNSQGHLLWKFQTGSPIFAVPAIGSDGTIYLGSGTTCLTCPYPQSEGVLYAINPAGKLKWNLITKAVEGGPLSSPTIGPDGTIYASQVGFAIVAVNPDGTLKWEVRTGGEVFDPPALALDGTVYAGIDDPDPSGLCGQCFVALNPDGTVKWSLSEMRGGFSSPAVGSDGTIYVDGLAVNPDGTVRWQNRGTFSSPSIGPDGTIYGSVDGGLYALSPDSTLKWRFPLDRSGSVCTPTGCSYVFVQQSSATIGSNGMVYFGSGVTHEPNGAPSYGNGNLYAVTPNGTLAWKFATGTIVGSCPGYVCLRVFSTSDPAIGADGTVYVGTCDGDLYAIGQA